MNLNVVSLIVGILACSLGILSIIIGDFDWAIVLLVAGFSNLIMSKLRDMEDEFLQEGAKH